MLAFVQNYSQSQATLKFVTTLGMDNFYCNKMNAHFRKFTTPSCVFFFSSIATPQVEENGDWNAGGNYIPSANYPGAGQRPLCPAHNRWCVCVCGCNYICTIQLFTNVECVCGDANW